MAGDVTQDHFGERAGQLRLHTECKPTRRSEAATLYCILFGHHNAQRIPELQILHTEMMMVRERVLDRIQAERGRDGDDC